MWSESIAIAVLHTTTYFRRVRVEISTQTVRQDTWAASLDQNPLAQAMKFWF